jgi:hypothetical protein
LLKSDVCFFFCPQFSRYKKLILKCNFKFFEIEIVAINFRHGKCSDAREVCTKKGPQFPAPATKSIVCCVFLGRLHILREIELNFKQTKKFTS